MANFDLWCNQKLKTIYPCTVHSREVFLSFFDNVSAATEDLKGPENVQTKPYVLFANEYIDAPHTENCRVRWTYDFLGRITEEQMNFTSHSSNICYTQLHWEKKFGKMKRILDDSTNCGGRGLAKKMCTSVNLKVGLKLKKNNSFIPMYRCMVELTNISGPKCKNLLDSYGTQYSRVFYYILDKFLKCGKLFRFWIFMLQYWVGKHCSQFYFRF